jgi:hypothetical protein
VLSPHCGHDNRNGGRAQRPGNRRPHRPLPPASRNDKTNSPQPSPRGDPDTAGPTTLTACARLVSMQSSC